MRKHTGGNGKSENNKMVYSRIHEPIGRYIAPEVKFLDFTQATSVSNTGSIGLCTFPAQGVTQSQRVGDRLWINKLDLSYTLQLSGATNDFCRYIVFQEKGLSSATPTAASILEQVVPVSPIKYNARDFYHILHDEFYSLVNNSSSAFRAIRTGVKVPIRDIHFTAGTTTPYSGQIWTLLISNGLNTVTQTAIHRFWFEEAN